MGADGGIYYYEDSKKNPFLAQLLLAFINWLCSDSCQFQFDWSLCVKDDTICKYDDDNGETEDDAVPFFTKEQLAFVNIIHSHISDFCNSNMRIPSDKSVYIMTWDAFEHKQQYDPDFGFRDDFNELLQTTSEINDAWDKAGMMWFYWDINSLHTSDPFDSEIDKLYDTCMKCPTSSDTFKQIFTDKKMFQKFVTEFLPTPDYVQAWT